LGEEWNNLTASWISEKGDVHLVKDLMKLGGIMAKRIRKRNLLLSVLVMIPMIMCWGCSKHIEQGLVEGYYNTVVQNGGQSTKKNPVTIRINDLVNDPLSKKDPLSGVVKLFPLLSLIPVHVVHTNQIGRMKLGNSEFEEILAKELRRSGIVEDVTYKGEQKDYDIRGKVNFIYKDNMHTSGLGLLVYYCLLPTLILPTSTARFTCEAHFEVVSADGTRVLLSKNYIAKSKWQYYLLYDNDRVRSCYGQEVLPQIVKQFIADLKALDPSVWRVTSKD